MPTVQTRNGKPPAWRLTTEAAARWGREFKYSLPLPCSHDKIAYNTLIPTPPEAPPPTPKTGRMTLGTQRRGRFIDLLSAQPSGAVLIVVVDGMDVAGNNNLK